MKKVIFVILLMSFLFLISCKSNNVANQDEEVKDIVEEINNKESNSNTNEEQQTNDTQEKSNNQEEKEEESVLNLDFALSDGKGNMIQLSEYKGQLVFLNFFTTWCIYCMQEMPEFQKITNEYDDIVEFVIVNVQTDPKEVSVEEVLEWYEEEGYTFPLVFDEEVNETKVFYPYIQGYPTTFVFDEEGAFLGSIPGAMNEEMILQIIEEYGPKN